MLPHAGSILPLVSAEPHHKPTARHCTLTMCIATEKDGEEGGSVLALLKRARGRLESGDDGPHNAASFCPLLPVLPCPACLCWPLSPSDEPRRRRCLGCAVCPLIGLAGVRGKLATVSMGDMPPQRRMMLQRPGSTDGGELQPSPQLSETTCHGPIALPRIPSSRSKFAARQLALGNPSNSINPSPGAGLLLMRDGPLLF